MSTDKSVPTKEELSKLPIAKLRQMAKHEYQLRVTPDLTSVDLVEAIMLKVDSPDADFVFDAEGDHPAPGRSRVIIQRDPNPSSTNSPVFLNLNGARILIKRGSEVDIPTKFVKLLNDCSTTQYREVPNQTGATGNVLYEAEDVLDFPYMVLDRTEGPDPYPGNEASKAGRYKRQLAFRDKFGQWPRGKDKLDL